ncbi:MAG: MMPL family transporter [Flavisolibacter sp.]
MWKYVAEGILRLGVLWLMILGVITAFLGWEASKVNLSYEFSKAIPTDNPKYIAYQEFKKKFGEDGNLLVIGVQTDQFFNQPFFEAYSGLAKQLKNLEGVLEVAGVTSCINLLKNESTEKLETRRIFADSTLSQSQINNAASVFFNLPFYKGLLYNPRTKAWVMGVSINNAVLNSPGRTALIGKITKLAYDFSAQMKIPIYLSGLPLIRTLLADRVRNEMKFFLVGSVLLSALILFIFFRSLTATFLSITVVIIGVVWSIGTLHLLGYKITLLTALVPPLIVVIGIPNCVYFLNKFHSAYRASHNKREAILTMVSKMGIVTLFCNIAAAIGFAVFALTKSAILKEFGTVAGINIMLLFFISLILIPIVLNYLPAPTPRHTHYLDNKLLQGWLDRLEFWALNHRNLIFSATFLIVIIALLGISRLKTVGYIVDDLPKTDKIYTDLKFFESNFKGVMPLEIVVDTKRKYGVTRNLTNLLKIDSFAAYLAAQPYIGKPLAISEGLKFAKQAFFDGDSANYAMPGENDLIALRPYLTTSNVPGGPKNTFSKLSTSFLDADKQEARISVSMQDVGSTRLPFILDSIQRKADQIFDPRKFKVALTGASVTFLEGNRFIINGLKDSIIWAFLLISLCMLYLFRSFRILICSLLPNLIPLIITAGVMGWVGVSLKPSTVLIFSVTLGIAIDITIRFLVNYRQQLQSNNGDSRQTVIDTIHSTGISIVYTSIVLVAGFIIFCFSSFGGTQSLGWLTSLTLITATIANLAFLPALILTIYKPKSFISV